MQLSGVWKNIHFLEDSLLDQRDPLWKWLLLCTWNNFIYNMWLNNYISGAGYFSQV